MSELVVVVTIDITETLEISLEEKQFVDLFNLDQDFSSFSKTIEGGVPLSELPPQSLKLLTSSVEQGSRNLANTEIKINSVLSSGEYICRDHMKGKAINLYSFLFPELVNLDFPIKKEMSPPALERLKTRSRDRDLLFSLGLDESVSASDIVLRFKQSRGGDLPMMVESVVKNVQRDSALFFELYQMQRDVFDEGLWCSVFIEAVPMSEWRLKFTQELFQNEKNLLLTHLKSCSPEEFATVPSPIQRYVTELILDGYSQERMSLASVSSIVENAPSSLRIENSEVKANFLHTLNCRDDYREVKPIIFSKIASILNFSPEERDKSSLSIDFEMVDSENIVELISEDPRLFYRLVFTKRSVASEDLIHPILVNDKTLWPTLFRELSLSVVEEKAHFIVEHCNLGSQFIQSYLAHSLKEDCSSVVRHLPLFRQYSGLSESDMTKAILLHYQESPKDNLSFLWNFIEDQRLSFSSEERQFLKGLTYQSSDCTLAGLERGLYSCKKERSKALTSAIGNHKACTLLLSQDLLTEEERDRFLMRLPTSVWLTKKEKSSLLPEIFQLIMNSKKRVDILEKFVAKAPDFLRREPSLFSHFTPLQIARVISLAPEYSAKNMLSNQYVPLSSILLLLKDNIYSDRTIPDLVRTLLDRFSAKELEVLREWEGYEEHLAVIAGFSICQIRGMSNSEFYEFAKSLAASDLAELKERCLDSFNSLEEILLIEHILSDKELSQIMGKASILDYSDISTFPKSKIIQSHLVKEGHLFVFEGDNLSLLKEGLGEEVLLKLMTNSFSFFDLYRAGFDLAKIGELSKIDSFYLSQDDLNFIKNEDLLWLKSIMLRDCPDEISTYYDEIFMRLKSGLLKDEEVPFDDVLELTKRDYSRIFTLGERLQKLVFDQLKEESQSDFHIAILSLKMGASSLEDLVSFLNDGRQISLRTTKEIQSLIPDHFSALIGALSLETKLVSIWDSSFKILFSNLCVAKLCGDNESSIFEISEKISGESLIDSKVREYLEALNSPEIKGEGVLFGATRKLTTKNREIKRAIQLDYQVNIDPDIRDLIRSGHKLSKEIPVSLTCHKGTIQVSAKRSLFSSLRDQVEGQILRLKTKIDNSQLQIESNFFRTRDYSFTSVIRFVNSNVNVDETLDRAILDSDREGIKLLTKSRAKTHQSKRWVTSKLGHRKGEEKTIYSPIIRGAEDIVEMDSLFLRLEERKSISQIDLSLVYSYSRATQALLELESFDGGLLSDVLTDYIEMALSPERVLVLVEFDQIKVLVEGCQLGGGNPNNMSSVFRGIDTIISRELDNLKGTRDENSSCDYRTILLEQLKRVRSLNDEDLIDSLSLITYAEGA